MDLSIRHIEPGNTEKLQQFESLFYQYAENLPEHIKSSVIKQLFTLPYFHGFLAEVDGKPAGFAVCYEFFSTYFGKKCLNIHDFMVSSNFRGKGLGKQLLMGIENYCRENDFLKMTLEVTDSNINAKKLYSSCGFEDYRVAAKDQLHWQKFLN